MWFSFLSSSGTLFQTLKFTGWKLRNEILIKLRRVSRRAKMHRRNQSKIIIEILGQLSEIMFIHKFSNHVSRKFI